MQTMKQSPDMKQQFAQTLRQAMENAGYAAKPAVLQREFNSRHPAEKPITLHGVRRWLMGETIPSYPKLQVLSDWLGCLSTTLCTAQPSLQAGRRKRPIRLGPWVMKTGR